MDNQPTTPQPCCQNDRWFKPAVIILGLLTVLGLSGNIYLLFQKQKTPILYTEQNRSATQVRVIATPTIDLVTNWRTYKNLEPGFEVKYPAEMNIVQEGWQQMGNDIKAYWILNLSYNENWQIMIDYRPKPKTPGGIPITKIEQSFLGEESPTYFTFQEFSAVSFETKTLTPSKSKTVNVLRNGALWSIREDLIKKEITKEFKIDQILSTFKFLD